MQIAEVISGLQTAGLRLGLIETCTGGSLASCITSEPGSSAVFAWGLVLGMNCRDNMTLPQVDALRAGPFVSAQAESEIFDHYKDKLEIKTPSWKQTVGNLSGGNQQKSLLASGCPCRPRC